MFDESLSAQYTRSSSSSTNTGPYLQSCWMECWALDWGLGSELVLQAGSWALWPGEETYIGPLLKSNTWRPIRTVDNNILLLVLLQLLWLILLLLLLLLQLLYISCKYLLLISFYLIDKLINKLISSCAHNLLLLVYFYFYLFTYFDIFFNLRNPVSGLRGSVDIYFNNVLFCLKSWLLKTTHTDITATTARTITWQ